MAESLCGEELIASSVYRLRPKIPHYNYGAVPWHQDSAYFEPYCDRGLVLTVWIPLVDTDEENGCLWVIPRAHRGQVVPHRPAQGKAYLEIPDADLPAGQHVCCPVPKGGALLFTNLHAARQFRQPHGDRPLVDGLAVSERGAADECEDHPAARRGACRKAGRSTIRISCRWPVIRRRPIFWCGARLRPDEVLRDGRTVRRRCEPRTFPRRSPIAGASGGRRKRTIRAGTEGRGIANLLIGRSFPFSYSQSGDWRSLLCQSGDWRSRRSVLFSRGFRRG